MNSNYLQNVVYSYLQESIYSKIKEYYNLTIENDDIDDNESVWSDKSADS